MREGSSKRNSVVNKYEQLRKTGMQIYWEQRQLHQIIDFYEELGKIDLAIGACELAGTQHPYTALFFIRKAELLFEKEEILNTLDALAEAEKLDTQHIRIELLEASIFFHQKQFKKGIAAVETALGLSGKKEVLDYLRSRVQQYDLEKRGYLKLVHLFMMATISVEDDNLFTEISALLKDSNYQEEACDFFQLLVDIEPFCAFAWLQLGEVEQHLGLYERAVESLEFAYALKDEHPTIILALAKSYSAVGEPSKATALLEEQKQEVLQQSVFQHTLACAYQSKGEAPRARQLFVQLLQRNPDYIPSIIELANLDRVEGDIDRAFRAFRHLCELEPYNNTFLSGKAFLAHQCGEHELAIEIYLELLKRDPYDKETWMQLASCYFELGYHNEAVDVTSSSLELLGDHPDLLYLSCIYLLECGRKGEAMEQLEKALSQDYEKHYVLFEMSPHFDCREDAMYLIDRYKPS